MMELKFHAKINHSVLTEQVRAYKDSRKHPRNSHLYMVRDFREEFGKVENMNDAQMFRRCLRISMLENK